MTPNSASPDRDRSAAAQSAGKRPKLPDWVPAAAADYLAHTEQGVPIRALARQSGQHASTILRRIRRLESLRDDPLVDSALRGLSRSAQALQGNRASEAFDECLQEVIAPSCLFELHAV